MKKILETLATFAAVGFGLFILYFGFRMLFVVFEQIFK